MLPVRGYGCVKVKKQKSHYEIMLWVILIAALIAWLSGGCASMPERGYFSVAEFDSRDPEQIVAATPSDTAVYLGSTTNEAKERSFTAWAALFDMIAKLKVRVRVLTLQWDKGNVKPSIVKIGG